jgi:WD40 repeat protein
VSFSPDGQTIASASDDRTVRLWQRDGTLIATLEGHADSVLSVNFSPDGQTIASASADDTVRLWQRDGTPIATLEGHKSTVNDVNFSPDGQTIASASNDQTVRLWNLDLNDLVEKGCDWLGDYLASNASLQERAFCSAGSVAAPLDQLSSLMKIQTFSGRFRDLSTS